MPTLSQQLENVQSKIRRWGPDAHCNQLIVSEESREKAIKNEPDEMGRQHTRVSLETYSPASYSLWNQIIETMMEKLGYNPILCIDVMAGIIRAAGDEGIELVKGELVKVLDYEAELRTAKAARRARKAAKA